MNGIILNDEFFMNEALKEAQKALEADEVPVGAVIVVEDIIIARAHNLTERLKDVTAHAEMMACSTAAEYLDAKYLTNCTLYVTLEPCVMCAGAIAWARPQRVVFGASDPKRGFLKISKSIIPARISITSGVCKEECESILNSFFTNKR